MAPAKSRRKNALLLLTAGVLLSGYVLLLLGVTHISQIKLIDAAHEQLRLDLEKRAAALSYFYGVRRDDLEGLASSRSFGVFFSNRALGMSMEYGLSASLLDMHRQFTLLAGGKRMGNIPIYDRLVLLEPDGKPLIDTAAGQELRLPKPFAPDEALRQPQLLVVAEGERLQVLLTTPVVYKDKTMGSLLAWVNQELVYQQLVEKASDNGGGRVIVATAAGPLQPRGSRLPDFGGAGADGAVPGSAGPNSLQTRQDGSGDYYVRVEVADTPLLLVGVYPRQGLTGYFTSYWFSLSLGVLAVLVLAGAGVAVRTQTHNLVLQTRVDESLRQERQLNKQNAQLAAEIHKRQQYEKELVRQASFDQLTGLPNRVLALDRLSRAMIRSARMERHVVVMFVDLDHFKKVNDTLGHAAGDKLLVEASQRFSRTVRGSDTVARLSGDEFLAILEEVGDPEDIERICDKMQQEVARPFLVDGQEFFLSVSIGIAVYPEDGEDPQALLKNADIALYQAKESGRQAYRFFTPVMNQRANERQQLEVELRHAIELKEFSLRFQPVIDLQSEQIVGAEALLRWTSPSLGEVAPLKFIPVAEDAGLIGKIGDWVLAEAAAGGAALNAIQPIWVSANVSTRQFRTPEHFLRVVDKVLASSGLAPEQFTIEVTESLLLDDVPGTKRILDELDAMGVRIAIDDFGTGYSALAYLNRFKFDVLKIDRTFVRDILHDPEDATLARAILAMAHALRLKVVAEGVEDEGQAQFLKDAGCGFAQGYYYGKPIPLDELVGRMQAQQAASLQP